MSLPDVIKKIEKLPPDQQEHILNITASKWLKQFTEAITKSKDPTHLIEQGQTEMTFCLIQLTQPEHRQVTIDFLKALAKASPPS